MLLKWKEWPKNVQNQLKMTKIMQIIGCVAGFKNFCSGPVPGRTARLFSGPGPAGPKKSRPGRTLPLTPEPVTEKYGSSPSMLVVKYVQIRRRHLASG